MSKILEKYSSILKFGLMKFEVRISLQGRENENKTRDTENVVKIALVLL